MKICFISEYFTPLYNEQFAVIKSILDICNLKKIEYIFVHKKSKYYSSNKILEKSISNCYIVHFIGGWPHFYFQTISIAYKLKKKIIIHPLNFNEMMSLSQKIMNKYLAWTLYQKKMLLKSDLIHCSSFKQEQNLKKLNKDFKTTILPFGIDQKSIVKKIKIKNTKKCLLYLDSQTKKNLDQFLKVWIEIDNTQWSLDIIGFKGQEYFKKINIYQKYKKIKFLKLLSIQNKKFLINNKYDLLVVPSVSENFGFLILEALAKGLPVLTTNLTPWSIIQDKNAGWIINNSQIELKLALYQILGLSNQELIIKKKNTIKIAKKFTKENLSKLYFKTYKEILSA